MPSALVTGSAKGIGKALLLALAEDDYDVAVHYRSSLEEAEGVAEEARGHGVRALVLQADVTKPEEAHGLVTAAHEEFGGLDVLVNNVGNYHKGKLAEHSLESWHEMFDSNLHATFYTCQAAVPLMRAGGRILNIGYAGAHNLVARPGVVAYAIAKTGVILYSKALAHAEAKRGITVNVISPGVMENSVTKPPKLPMGREGSLIELVAAARYFLSDEARYVTGANLEVAGGWNL
ncbi:bifunctional dihydropteridine reductase/dihydrofolate reductase TmpR [soil metagenome]|jgi:NAD(P)-dependent dehydrogenase (short-subunit alcohol dehydrogenase family)|nr:bifunctional dihydropteridine reductase/dihydrofolate reductase TmpR [Deinococcota bacterium]